MTGARLLLLLRTGDRGAEERILEELRRHGGDVSATARELGVSTDSLYRHAKRDAAWGRRFRALCQGLAGAQRAGVAARLRRAQQRAREKK